MRRILALCLFCVALAAPPALAQSREKEIEGIITSQIEAFRKDDGAAAFAFAAPGLKDYFHDERNFMAMVRQGYPQVYRPRDFTFSDLREVNGRLTQFVEITDGDGQRWIAAYTMVQQADGSWLIGGCVILKAPETTV